MESLSAQLFWRTLNFSANWARLLSFSWSCFALDQLNWKQKVCLQPPAMFCLCHLYQILYNICFDFSQILKTEKKNACFWPIRTFVLFFNWEILVKMLFCFQNCFYPLWEKVILVIEKNFWKSRLKAENFQNVWDHLNDRFKQWKVTTISDNRMIF